MSGPSVAEYAAGVVAGDRALVARAITLVESTRPDHRAAAQELLGQLPSVADTRRVGITGVPGVGKSTFIDTLGSQLVEAGHRVAVLAVDPSSSRTGGSILGDKTRMARLATHPAAFVRPSPTAGTLGGVTRATREAMVVVEAAGYDVVLVETVGVGQSETTVADMVDSFLLLSLARTGDQLQGIKKGVLELADVIAVNKADGAHAVEAAGAARELTGALRLLRGAERTGAERTGAERTGAEGAGVERTGAERTGAERIGADSGGSDGGWQPPVLTCSALTGDGVENVWRHLLRHRSWLTEHGELVRRRQEQQVRWVRALVREALLDGYRHDPRIRALRPEIERAVADGTLTPALAAQQLLDAYRDASIDR